MYFRKCPNPVNSFSPCTHIFPIKDHFMGITKAFMLVHKGDAHVLGHKQNLSSREMNITPSSFVKVQLAEPGFAGLDGSCGSCLTLTMTDLPSAGCGVSSSVASLRREMFLIIV